MNEVILATTDSDITAMRQLFEEYAASLAVINARAKLTQ
jgi:hypothetical protein